jgi:hypothetical protein
MGEDVRGRCERLGDVRDRTALLAGGHTDRYHHDQAVSRPMHGSSPLHLVQLRSAPLRQGLPSASDVDLPDDRRFHASEGLSHGRVVKGGRVS